MIKQNSLKNDFFQKHAAKALKHFVINDDNIDCFTSIQFTPRPHSFVHK